MSRDCDLFNVVKVKRSVYELLKSQMIHICSITVVNGNVLEWVPVLMDPYPSFSEFLCLILCLWRGGMGGVAGGPAGLALTGLIFGPVTVHNTVTSSNKSESDYIGEA